MGGQAGTAAPSLERPARDCHLGLIGASAESAPHPDSAFAALVTIATVSGTDLNPHPATRWSAQHSSCRAQPLNSDANSDQQPATSSTAT